MLFANFRCALETYRPMKLTVKFNNLGLSTTLINFILQTDPKHFRLAVTPPLYKCSTLGTPRAMCSAPSHCTPRQQPDVKYADATTITGCSINNNDSSNWEKFRNLAEWCIESNTLSNSIKTKKLIVHFRMEAKTRMPFDIRGGGQQI